MIDFDELQETIRYKFRRANDMTEQQVDNFAAIAVLEVRKYLDPILKVLDGDSLNKGIEGVSKAWNDYKITFDKVFRPQPTRGSAPTNPATRPDDFREDV